MEELIRKSDARAAVLHTNPASTYCIDNIKPVDARMNAYGVWLDAGKNLYGQNLARCSACNANSIEGGLFCRCCGAIMKQ